MNASKCSQGTCQKHLRKWLVRPGKTAWTQAHRAWLAAVELPLAPERLVMSEYLQQVAACEQRRERLDAAIAELAASPDWAPVVSRVGAVRGAETVTAFSLAAEIGDFSRFPSAPALMFYLGLVPSEDPTGGKAPRGPITRTGNRHARTLLVEAAWHRGRR